jgi:Flp pilus assembly protein TadD
MAQLEQSARDYPGALFAIATEQLGSGQMVEGAATIRRFLELMPNHVNSVPAREMLARAYVAQGNAAAAEAEARQLVAFAPSYARGHDLLGRLLAQKGDFPGAAEAFRRVVALQPGNREAQQNLAAVQRLAAGNR